MEKKAFYLSKTFWVNIISIVGVFTAHFAGYEINAEMTVTILGVINVVLRFITKKEITLT